MERRKFTREFKLEAVRLIKQRGVSFAQASQDLSVHVSVFRPIVRPVLRRELYFLKRKRQTLTPAANELANGIFEQFRKLQDRTNLNSFTATAKS